jgi:hypothetical protein
LAGCTSTTDDLPVQIGGPAAAGGGGNSGTQVTGRVCMLADPRILSECSDTLAGGLSVSLGSSRTLTLPNGQFTMSVPTGSTTSLSFAVAGSSVITASQPFSNDITIPVLPSDLFGQILAANGIALTHGSGTILASVVDRGGVPLAGVTATSTPSSAFGPFFDGTTPTAWTLNGTGERGVVMFPGVAVGPVALSFGNIGSTGESTVDGVQVIDGGITIVDAVLP